MPKLTQQAAICAALLQRGYTEVPGSTRKFRTFLHPSSEATATMFVGKAGALRRGRTVTDSISLERTPVRPMLLQEGGWKG